jgi:hypothetical protein
MHGGLEQAQPAARVALRELRNRSERIVVDADCRGPETAFLVVERTAQERQQVVASAGAARRPGSATAAGR